MDGVASIDGCIVPLSQASVPLCDRGVLFGHALFETLLVLEGKIIFWEEHLERLLAGCATARINPPNAEQLWHWSARLVEANIAQSSRVAEKMQLRLMVSGGLSPLLWDEKINPQLSSAVYMFCRNIPGLSPGVYADGWRLALAAEERSRSMLGIKSCNYLLPMMALARARERGFDDALFVNDAGEMTESTTASLFWQLDDGVFCSSPTADRCLPGTTLLGIRKGLERDQQRFREETLHREQLASIRCLWIASSTRGVVPVRGIEDREFSIADSIDTTEYLNRILRMEQLAGARPVI